MKGAERFEFTFELGGVVILECVAIFRFGKVQEVTTYFNGKVFDTDGIVLDWQDEFMPLAESLKHYAQKFHDEPMEDANGSA